jgi:hypothetical protein
MSLSPSGRYHLATQNITMRMVEPRRNGSPCRETSHAPIPRDYLRATLRIDRVFAVQQIRRMRGGTQAQLLRCSDGCHYVVKFQNNPQGMGVLASDLLGTLLAIQLGLPVQQPALVDVRGDLICATEDMVIQMAKTSVPCHPGVCFGSRYPSDESCADGSILAMVQELSPHRNIDNLSDYAGMLVFDQWTCNTDNRQIIFVTQDKRRTFHASMIDQGNCFNGAEWTFPDSPLRGIYNDHAAYVAYRRFDVFEPWLSRIENETSQETLRLAGSEIPPEWYLQNTDALSRLLDRLDVRRKRVRELLWCVLKKSPGCFPNWTR